MIKSADGRNLFEKVMIMLLLNDNQLSLKVEKVCFIHLYSIQCSLYHFGFRKNMMFPYQIVHIKH